MEKKGKVGRFLSSRCRRLIREEAMKSHLVPFCFRFTGIKRGIGVVLIMLWALSASVLHAKTKPFVPADRVGPYNIGYKQVELVDPSRDAAFGGRRLFTHIWYPIDDAAAAGAIPVIYDVGLASLALFGIPVSHIIARSPFGALVDASSTLPPSGDIPGACTAPPLPPDPADPCGTSVIVGLPVSSRGPFPLLMFSHGSGGDPGSYISLTEYLASHGYIVVAPEHTGDRFVDYYALGLTGLGCETLLSRPCPDDVAKSAVDRPQDISFVLDRVLAGNASVAPAAIDTARIGMYGHSFGGYTALAVAGGTVSGALPDSRIKAIAPLSPPASAFAFVDPGLVPLIGNIEVPTLVSFGTADQSSGINLVEQGREIFTDLDTRAVGEKYRVEIRRGVHNGVTDFCAFVAGSLEVIQQGNANPLFDPFNLAVFLTFDLQIPPLPPVALGKSRDGPQALCSPDLFYHPDNFAVWNAVTLPDTAVPLSTLLFPPDQIPGYIDANSQYTPSLASSTHLQIVNTEVVAFFSKHLKGDKRYRRYLLPSYAHAKKLAAEFAYCKATPGTEEVCFDKHSTE
jgi:dienelactone hydrolase